MWRILERAAIAAILAVLGLLAPMLAERLDDLQTAVARGSAPAAVPMWFASSCSPPRRTP